MLQVKKDPAVISEVFFIPLWQFDSDAGAHAGGDGGSADEFSFGTAGFHFADGFDESDVVFLKFRGVE